MAADAIFCVTNGNSMPSKHLQVGLVMKAVTGSRKTLEMLNRLGHCASYHTVEGLETELTYSVSDAQRLLPDGLAQLPDLHTGVAYDNYDRYVDTLSGRNTLHITVGIIYQDNPGKAIISTLLNPDKRQRNSSVPGSRKRRAYEVPGFVIEPYYKKPKMTKETMLAVDDPKRLYVSESLEKARFYDFIWLSCLAVKKPNIPMWCGYNSTKTSDPLPIQKLCYLPQINMSPTSLSVVVQTMKMSQRIADECDQKYITYDLAIAKLALCIQAEESPKFDNLFIQLGHFHINMSFFKALGKFIEDSGGPYILTETGALAPGSLLGFLNGKHYI